MARKKQRAPHGDGSVYSRQDGRWVASFRTGNKRRYMYAATQKEALQKLRKAQAEYQSGTLVEPSKQKTGDYLNYWIGIHETALLETTAVTYHYNLKTHIIPLIGHIGLQKLTAAHIQSMYASLANAGIKASTLRRNIHIIVNAALGQAVEWGLIGRNPCQQVKLPRVIKREMEVLNQEQIQTLLKAIEGDKHECLITLALATGMRKGELLALHWSDVDLGHKVVQVQRSLAYVPGKGLHEHEPKTKNSRRSIVLAQHAIDALKKHRVRQIKQRWQASTEWQEHDLVFCNMYGCHIWPVHVQRDFLKLLHKTELPVIRFHDLRHSCATALLRWKVQPKVVQEILGHSSIAITMDIYSHVLPDIQQEAMVSMDSFLSGNLPEKGAI